MSGSLPPTVAPSPTAIGPDSQSALLTASLPDQSSASPPAAETLAPSAHDPTNVSASMLEDKIPDQYRLPRVLAAAVAVIGVIYLYFTFRPLWHSDLWGHLNYGRTITQIGRLPATEPLLPLAKGMPLVDTAWLWQVLAFSVIKNLGLAGLQGLHGGSVALGAGLLLQRMLQRVRRFGFAVAGLAVYLWIQHSHLIIMRPQLAGMTCFIGLLSIVLRGKPSIHDWWSIPALFTLWANLHGSFPIGWLLLGAVTAGRAVDLLRRTGELRSLAHDAAIRRWFVLTQLAVIAALINPYGLRLFETVWRFGDNPNLRDLTEWQPLSIREPVGWAMALSVVALAVIYRLTPRRVQSWEVLTLTTLGLAALYSGRMTIWWGPIASLLFTIHAHAAWARWRGVTREVPDSPRTGKWSLVTLGIIWICFAYSPLGMRLIHRQQPEPKRALSAETPYLATEYLREHRVPGLVFSLYEWSDYLQWQGLPTFINSHVQIIPREVWQHYMTVITDQAGWEEVLDRYGINTVVLDKGERDSLIRRFRDHPGWRSAYDDQLAVIFVRKRPIDTTGVGRMQAAAAAKQSAEQSGESSPVETPRSPTEATRTTPSR